MYNVSMYSIIGICFTVSLLLMGSILSVKTTDDKEKGGPFECGFDPSGSSRLPFCMKFFLIGIIFLIFDVEVTLIFPLPYSQSFIVMFITLLMLGLIYEWYYGGLEWMVYVNVPNSNGTHSNRSTDKVIGDKM